MADEELRQLSETDDRVPISEFTEPVELDNNDVVPVLHTVNNVLTTMKAKLTLLATHLLKVMQFSSDLHTSNKTIIGAINELEEGGGGGGSSTLAGLTDVSLSSPANQQALVYDGSTSKWKNASVAAKITGEASGAIANFNTSLAMPLVALKAYIQALGGGGTPQDENPIIGFDNVVITQARKNLFDKTATDTTKGYISGYYLLSNGNTNQGSAWNVSEYIKVNPNDKFVVSGISGNSPAICFYNSNKEYISGTAYNGSSSVAVTTPNNCVYVRISYNDNTIDTVQFEHGSTATAYAPYNADTFTIQLGQTVYGAYAEKNTGKLVINSAIVDLGTLANWSYDSTNQRFYSWNLTSTIKAPPSNSQTIYMLCSAYSVYALGSLANYGIAVSTTKNIYIKNTDYDNTTINDFIASLSGVKLVYELAVPIETDITIPDIVALVGENNIFADSGDIEVKYFNSGAEDSIDLIKLISGSQVDLVGTLTAGQTSITISDSVITTDSTIEIFTDPEVEYNSQNVTSGSITITFDAQASDLGVKVRVT